MEATVNEVVIGKATEQIAKHLRDYAKQIQATMEKSENGDVSVSLGLKLSDMGQQGLKVETTIGFSLGKVKDKWADVIGQAQLGLPV
jgi:hypothetical protein